MVEKNIGNKGIFTVKENDVSQTETKKEVVLALRLLKFELTDEGKELMNLIIKTINEKL